MIKAGLPAGYSIAADRDATGRIYGYRVHAPNGRLLCFGVPKDFAERQAAWHLEGLTRGFPAELSGDTEPRQLEMF